MKLDIHAIKISFAESVEWLLWGMVCRGMGETLYGIRCHMTVKLIQNPQNKTPPYQYNDIKCDKL